MYINPPLTAVCVFNACDDDNTQKSNYYNDDLLSLSCAKYLSLSSKEEDTTTTKKTQTLRKKKGKNLVAHFFCVKTSFCCSFRVLSCEKNNLVCKLSSL